MVVLDLIFEKERLIVQILVEVFGGTQKFSGGWGCSSGRESDCCGPTITLEESTVALGKELRQIHGEKVEVKYIDTDQTGLKSYPSVAKVIIMGYSFPVIAVNGEPRMAGGIDVEAIRNILDEYLTKPE